MADKYSTIQQHQPLRIPTGWNASEKALIVQLEEILDDIYRRFGRLTIKDLGKELKTWIKETDDGIDSKISKTETYSTAEEIVSAAETYINDELVNYSTSTQTSEEISAYVADNAYEKKSGILITSEGIEILGDKFVNIKTGCTFKVESGGVVDIDSNNFKIDSTNKLMTVENWTLDEYGLQAALSNTYARIGIDSSGDLVFSSQSSDPHAPLGYDMHLKSGMPVYAGSIGNTAALLFIDPVSTPAEEGMIGTQDILIKEIWADYVCYNNLVSQSSRRIKDNIQDLPSLGEKLDALHPVSFEYKKKPGKRHYGLIYEDTVPVAPEICEVNEECGAINYLELVPMLLKEVQELRARVSELEAKVNV